MRSFKLLDCPRRKLEQPSSSNTPAGGGIPPAGAFFSKFASILVDSKADVTDLSALTDKPEG